jgi:hypothetical protein
MRRWLTVTGLLVAALLAPSGTSAKTASAFGIRLQQCFINETSDHTHTNGVSVVYFNAHQTPATEVDFLVRYHGQTYTLTDTGSFTHYAQISHTLSNALVGEVWQGATPALCIPARVVFANGKVLE